MIPRPYGGSVAARSRGLRIVGVIARQVAELLALAGARHQVLGLLLGGRHLLGRLAFRGDHDLAEEHLLLAHVFGLVLFVVLLQLGLGDVDVAQLTSCPITRCVSI